MLTWISTAVLLLSLAEADSCATGSVTWQEPVTTTVVAPAVEAGERSIGYRDPRTGAVATPGEARPAAAAQVRAAAATATATAGRGAERRQEAVRGAPGGVRLRLPASARSAWVLQRPAAEPPAPPAPPAAGEGSP